MPFDEDRANRAIRFISSLKHTKGEFAGRPFILYDWQADIIRTIFGTVTPEGYRQYRECFMEIARKNGKSEIAAAVALYLLFADREPGAEIYGAACDRDQASIVFNVAAAMVRQSPELSRRCKVIDSQKRIIVPTTNSFYRAIPADAAGSHGFNAHGVVLDEVHTQPSRDLYDVLTTSMSARRQPLIFGITTAGTDKHSLCYELYDHARQVRDGVVEDPTFLPIIYEAPAEADWRDESVWHMANPGLGDFKNLDDMRRHALKAEQVPAYENTFRNLHLNQWTAQETRWLPMTAWDACAGELDFKGDERPIAYGGLDMANTTDIAAFALAFPPEDEGAPYLVKLWFWIPAANIADRVRRDKVPYDLWVRQGWITATEGNVIDYKAIRETLSNLPDRFGLNEIAFDRWGAVQLMQEIEETGATVIPFGQGYASMSSPTKALLDLVLSGRFRHDGNPVLRWMADNLVVTTDPAGNVKPDKAKSTEKIDGMVAVIMALDRAIRNQDSGGSVYDGRGLLTI